MNVIIRVVLRKGAVLVKYKSSKQRDMIVEYLNKVDGHVTAEEIFKNMNEDGQKISLATVYRNLNILVEMNEIKKIAHPTLGYQYDKTCRPHYHLHCIKCNRILDLNIPYLEDWNEQIQAQTGLTIQSHTMMAEGICADCMKKHD